MAHPNGDLAKLKLDYDRARSDLLEARERCRRLRAELVALVGHGHWWPSGPGLKRLPKDLRDGLVSRALNTVQAVPHRHRQGDQKPGQEAAGEPRVHAALEGSSCKS